MGAQPQYSWRNKIAEVKNAGSTGNLFQYSGVVANPQDQLRGGAFPSVTNVEGGLVQPNLQPMLSQVQQPVRKGVVTGRMNR